MAIIVAADMDGVTLCQCACRAENEAPLRQGASRPGDLNLCFSYRRQCTCSKSLRSSLCTAGKSKFDFRHLILFSTSCGWRRNPVDNEQQREGALRLLTEAAKWSYLCPRGAVLFLLRITVARAELRHGRSKLRLYT